LIEQKFLHISLLFPFLSNLNFKIVQFLIVYCFEFISQRLSEIIIILFNTLLTLMLAEFVFLVIIKIIFFWEFEDTITFQLFLDHLLKGYIV